MKHFITILLSALLFSCAEGGQGGYVAFSSDFARYQERDGLGKVEVARTAGSVGSVTVKVKLTTTEGATTQYSWEDTELTWQDGEDGVKSVYFDLYDTRRLEGTTYFVLALERVSSSAETIVSDGTHLVCISDSTRLCFERPVYEFSVYEQIPVSLIVPVLRNGEGGVLSSRIIGGHLPDGLQVSYSATLSALVISGTLKSGNTKNYSFSMRPIATISGCGIDNTITGEASDFVIKVRELTGDLPDMTEGHDYPVIPLYWQGSYLAGVVSVSVTPQQKIIAKVVSSAGKMSFSGTWSAYDHERGVMMARFEKRKNVLLIEMDSLGVMSASFYPATNSSDFGDSENPVVGSAREAFEGGFSKYVGVYTLQLPILDAAVPTDKPIGHASMTLTLDSSGAKAGKVKFSGCLPEGSKLSGTTLFFYDKNGILCLPIYSKKGKESFGAVFAVSEGVPTAWRNAADASKQNLVSEASGTVPYYLHKEKNYYNLQGMKAYGGAWNKYAKLDSVCDLFDTGREFNMVFGTNLGSASDKYGKFSSATTNEVFVSRTGRVGAYDRYLKVKVNSTLGTLSGSASFLSDDRKRIKGKFQGVIMPGWSDRPFACGTFWFKDKINGLSRIRSIPFDLCPIE